MLARAKFIKGQGHKELVSAGVYDMKNTNMNTVAHGLQVII